MIRGSVNGRHEAMGAVKIRSAGGRELLLNAIVDTGFSASLALPVAVVESPDLTRETLSGAVLAGGTIKQFSVYSSEVEWNGAWKPVLISAVGQEALIGMRLLQGCQLSISVEPDGDVQIAEIS